MHIGLKAMEMSNENYTRTCKKCGTEQSIPADWFKTNATVKIYVCPNCRHQTKLNVAKIRLQKFNNFLEHTIIVGAEKSNNFSLKIEHPHFKCLFDLEDTVEVIEIKRGNELTFLPTEIEKHYVLNIPDKFISRNHAIIQLQNTSKILKYIDKGSTNGTIYNGEKLDDGDEIILSVKDKIEIGKTIIEIY